MVLLYHKSKNESSLTSASMFMALCGLIQSVEKIEKLDNFLEGWIKLFLN